MHICNCVSVFVSVASICSAFIYLFVFDCLQHISVSVCAVSNCSMFFLFVCVVSICSTFLYLFVS